eukprot:568585-Pelagomonas_calceolata.AAC.1
MGSHVAYYPSPYRGRPTTASPFSEAPKRGLKKGWPVPYMNAALTAFSSPKADPSRGRSHWLGSAQ